jgi:glutamate dehydrogenase/leucine dehydrogenase
VAVRRRRAMDALANGGGVTVSCFEWQQNVHEEHWSKKDVHKKLDAKMREATNIVWEMSKKHKVPMRSAAYMVALERMGEKMNG